jgi:hypothetical protein
MMFAVLKAPVTTGAFYLLGGRVAEATFLFLSC